MSETRDEEGPGTERAARGKGRPDPSVVLVAILDDHELLRASLGAALEADGYRVAIPPLTELGEVVEVLTAVRPAVALLDIDLGGFGTGEDLLPILRQVGSRVLVVSGTNDEAAIGRCLCAGAWGWVPKSSSFETLLEAVIKTAAGEEVLTPGDRERLEDAWRRHRVSKADALAPFEQLTKREAAVLGMLVEGKAVERIATESYVSVATVRTQVRAILMKLGVKSQLEAVAEANRSGWLNRGDSMPAIRSTSPSPPSPKRLDIGARRRPTPGDRPETVT